MYPMQPVLLQQPLFRQASLLSRPTLRSWWTNIAWSPLSPLMHWRNVFRVEPFVTPGP